MGDIPLSMQVKLLRLLETGTYRRVGSTELMRADVRLISATHRPLKTLVERGEFRQDLFYRINTFPIALPPLRARQEDIPLLVTSLLARVAPERQLRCSAQALKLLGQYGYPGNVRELRNILERASLLCDGDTIESRHLPEELLVESGSGNTGEVSPTMDDGLPDHELMQLLQTHRGSRKALAERLGLSERTLYRRIRKLR